MQFETQTTKRTILSKDAFNRKWLGSTTIKVSNLGNFYIIKVILNIQSFIGIDLGDFKLAYLKNGEWKTIANGYDIDNNILEEFRKLNYDNLNEVYNIWILLCKEYILNIRQGL